MACSALPVRRRLEIIEESAESPSRRRVPLRELLQFGLSGSGPTQDQLPDGVKRNRECFRVRLTHKGGEGTRTRRR